MVNSSVGAACIELTGKQVAPDGANICYGVLSCYKQVAPTELIGHTFFKKLKCYDLFNYNRLKTRHV